MLVNVQERMLVNGSDNGEGESYDSHKAKVKCAA